MGISRILAFEDDCTASIGDLPYRCLTTNPARAASYANMTIRTAIIGEELRIIRRTDRRRMYT